MITNNKAAAMKNYGEITSAIRQQDAKHVEVQGDEYKVVDSFVMQGETGKFTVHAGSHFDNDPKTPDSVKVNLHGTNETGHTETREFEHYSKKKLFVLNDERMKLTVIEGKQGDGAWFSSSQTVDFSV